MRISTPHWLVVTAATLVACGSSSSAPPPPPAAAPAPVPETPAWVMPDVLGVNALADENDDPNIVEVTLAAGTSSTTYVPGKKAQVFAYNGMLPGPVLKAKVGDHVIVHFKNKLAEATTIHWHGLRISDQMDGSPRVQSPVKPGAEFTYDFVVPDAGSFWYHPHVNTAAQVEKGLYAPIVVFDPAKDPTYDAERFLVLDDIRLEADGTISPQSKMDGMMGGRFGNMMLTNGRPVKEAVASVEQGTVERWRIVNSANARTMQIGVEGASFRVIATDGGLLPEPYTTTAKISVPIGQRYDLEVTYDRPGSAKLVNFVESADANGNPTIVKMSSFTVDVAASDRVPRDITWPSVSFPDRTPDGKATITLDAVQSNDMPWTINGKSDSMAPLFTWPQGATVDVTIVNKVAMEHPFHLHGQFFEVLDAKQPGLKDVVLVPPNGTVKIRAYIDNPGHWMAHCHILEHAEMGMMGEIYVTPDPNAPALGPMSR
jgi:FtsP/CotA-like multicopper oxidase with cupredoxin domain